jgi:hypothetical protein
MPVHGVHHMTFGQQGALIEQSYEHVRHAIWWPDIWSQHHLVGIASVIIIFMLLAYIGKEFIIRAWRRYGLLL